MKQTHLTLSKIAPSAVTRTLSVVRVHSKLRRRCQPADEQRQGSAYLGFNKMNVANAVNCV